MCTLTVAFAVLALASAAVLQAADAPGSLSAKELDWAVPRDSWRIPFKDERIWSCSCGRCRATPLTRSSPTRASSPAR
jgi:hypothetical protein